MYIARIRIRNIRSIKNFDFNLKRSEFAGWHVILGDNGTGKSSVIRAAAAAIIGPDQIAALRQDWGMWLDKKSSSGFFFVSIDRNSKEDLITGGGTPGKNYYIGVGFSLKRKVLSRGYDDVIAQEIEGKLSSRRYV
ncbi:MAG: AAA family ATPase, partial [Phycisphaerales bacterium]|nr:AAA family ATPase [Phycisphaerales bacterium]